MAELTFSPEDFARVDDVCADLDPERHPLTAEALAEIDRHEDREDVLTYFRKALRAECLAGVAARAMGDALIMNDIAHSKAVRGWIEEDYGERMSKGHLRERVFSHDVGRFGPGLWRMAEIDPPPSIWPSFWALLDLANDRMFETFDSELLNLMEGEGDA